MENKHQEPSIVELADCPNQSVAKLTCDSNSSVVLEKRVAQAKAEISAVLERIPSSCEEPQEVGSFCNSSSVGFVPKEGRQSSKGKRVLVMDTGFYLPAMTRYKSRVLEYLKLSDAGHLKTISEKIVVNNATLSIFSLLDEKYPELPPILLKSEYEARSVKMKNIPGPHYSRPANPGMKFNHGTVIFTKLAEFNPESEFVLIEMPSTKLEMIAAGLEPHFCSIESDVNWKAKYAAFYEKEANEIMAIIKKHQIGFVNFSFSESLETLRLYWKHACPNTPIPASVLEEMLKLKLAKFIAPLYNIPDVIVVQAIDPSGDFRSDEGKASNSIDCTPFPNSVRVGVISHLDSRISKEGSSDIHLLPEWERNAISCMDLAVNLGPIDLSGWETNTDKPECGVRFSPDGFAPGVLPELPWFSTSHAAPIALSYLIYLKSTLPPGTATEEIIKIATGSGKNFIKDPIRHREIEVYRLGYLDKN